MQDFNLIGELLFISMTSSMFRKEFDFYGQREKLFQAWWIDSSLSSEIRDSLSAEDVASIFPDETSVINCNTLSLEVLKNPTNNRLKRILEFRQDFLGGDDI